MTIAVLGAGAIGVWVGAEWGAALIGRADVLAPLQVDGLRMTGGADRRIAASDIAVSGVEALGGADLIVLACKATGLERAIGDLRAHARAGTPVLCLLNGVSPVRILAEALPGTRVFAGMVPFNVVWRGPAHLHRSSAGQVAVEDDPALPVLPGTERRGDMRALQYGKLLLNLINPINALSGLPLHGMLSQKPWRAIYGAALREAIGIYDAAGVDWVKAGPIPSRWAPALLALPDAVFVHTLLRLQGIDRTSMTSMASDLAAGRATEVDVLNGEIAAMGDAPVNAGLTRLVHEAEAGGRAVWSAPDLSRALGL